MSHPIVTSVTLVAAAATGVGVAQVLPGLSGLSLVLNGTKVTAGVAVFDAPRRVALLSGGNDSGITFTVTGTGGSWLANTAISEVVAGTNGSTAVTKQDFLTVTSVVASGASAGNVTVGTNGTGSGPWVIWDSFTSDFQVSCFGVVLSGAPTWGVEYTYDDVFGLWLPPATIPRALPLAAMTGLLGTADGALTNGCRASRLTLSAVGGVQLTQQQQGA